MNNIKANKSGQKEKRLSGVKRSDCHLQTAYIRNEAALTAATLSLLNLMVNLCYKFGDLNLTISYEKLSKLSKQELNSYSTGFSAQYCKQTLMPMLIKMGLVKRTFRYSKESKGQVANSYSLKGFFKRTKEFIAARINQTREQFVSELAEFKKGCKVWVQTWKDLFKPKMTRDQYLRAKSKRFKPRDRQEPSENCAMKEAMAHINKLNL